MSTYAPSETRREFKLRQVFDLDDRDRFDVSKRYGSAITIAVNRVSVNTTLDDEDLSAGDSGYTSVNLSGNGVLKDGNLGAPRRENYASLSALPDDLRAIVEANIAAFKATLPL